MVSFTFFRGWSRRATIRASASHEFDLMRPVIQLASSGSVLHWSRKRITSGGPMAQAAVRIRASRLSNRSDLYVMTYTALSPKGPRIALAVSEDLFHWQRLGLATFRPYHGIEFDGVDNKDASVFPVAIPDPSGQPAMAILHRPLFPGTRPEETACHPTSALVDLHRESIWISYCPTRMEDCEPYHLWHFGSHHRLAAPVAPWERLKIGGGTPPVMTRHGWLIIYHGVGETRADHRPNYATRLE